jgi:hypothetical protein
MRLLAHLALIAVLALVAGHGIGAGPAAVPYPDLPVNRWVQVDIRCEGGKSDYAGGCPSSRGWIQLAYDSKRQRVVLFGGSGEWYFNDLWSFDWKTRVWHLVEQDSRLGGLQRDPKAYPPGRDNHQWVYDGEKDKFWLYGGTGGAGFWEWRPDTRKWRLAQQQHDGKTLPFATLDPAFAIAEDLRGVLLFGGERYSFDNHTWWFDLDQEHWRKLNPPAAPPPRAQTENAMVYDGPRKQFILYGGRSPTAKPLQDTWIFDATKRTWRQIKTMSGPPPRDSHILVFDRKSEVAILLGGTGLKTADTWLFSPKTERWTELVSARGDYKAADSRVVSAVYVPEADLTIYRDVRGRVYFLRLDLSRDYQTPSTGPARWKPPKVATP